MNVPAATALVVVDVQHDFVAADPAPLDADSMLAAIRVLLEGARTAGALVVHVQDVGDTDPRFPAGSPGRGLVLLPLDGEPVVSKEVDDPFEGTGLADLLAGHEVVAACGLQSEMCVAAAARGLMARGLTVVLPDDAHSTFDIPARPGGTVVPAEHVRRVAAWSLGDEVHLPRTAVEVRFASATA